MCASSNWRSVRTSTTSAPVALLLLDLPRRERMHLDARRQQRPAVDVDDRLEVRWLRRQLRGRALDEAVLVGLREAARCGGARSRSWRRPSGPCRGRRRAIRRGGRARPRVFGRSVSSFSCRQRKMPRAPSVLVDREVGARDVADEQRVAGQHGPRLVAARACRSARRPCARAGGPGCASRARGASRAPAPSRRRTARARSPAAASRWMWIVAPVAAASRPCPETWSAWLCVSRTCSIARPCSARAAGTRRSRSAGRRPPRRRRRSSPIRYEAQPRSSCVIWRKITTRRLTSEPSTQEDIWTLLASTDGDRADFPRPGQPVRAPRGCDRRALRADRARDPAARAGGADAHAPARGRVLVRAGGPCRGADRRRGSGGRPGRAGRQAARHPARVLERRATSRRACWS